MNVRTTSLAVLVTVLTLLPAHTSRARESEPVEAEEDEPSIDLYILVEMTWYDPALCSEQPINCMGDPTKTAGNYNVADWYDLGIACPSELAMGTVLDIEGYGPKTCIDRGGNMLINGDGVFRIDLLHRASEGSVPREIIPARVSLTGEEVSRILATHTQPFVEPIYQFGCPATSCEEMFYQFGQTVTEPTTGRVYTHWGTDFYTGDSGMGPVFAAADGQVVKSDVHDVAGSRCGGRIVIDHGYGWDTTYCHLTDRQVHETDFVRAGDLIGHAGWSGYTLEGQHVHIELRHDGELLNFATYLGESGSYGPIDMATLKQRLDAAGVIVELTIPDPLQTAYVPPETLEVEEPPPLAPAPTQVEADKDAGDEEIVLVVYTPETDGKDGESEPEGTLLAVSTAYSVDQDDDKLTG